MRWVQRLGLAVTFSALSAMPAPGQTQPSGGPEDAWVGLLTWRHDSQADTMRGLETQSATIASLTTADLSSPYGGGSKLVLQITRDPRFDETIAEYTVVLTVAPGQIICDQAMYGTDSCIVSYRIDDDPVTKLGGRIDRSSAEYPQFVADGSSNQQVSGHVGGRQMVDALRDGRRLTVEVPTYQNGRLQFEFAAEGLAIP